MKLVGERTITEAQVAQVVANIQEKKCSKGAGIRELFAGGMEVKEIAAVTGIKYNHVYNVVKNEVLVNDLEVETTGRSSENSKKAQIGKLLEEGKSITEISRELKCLYNYVWQVAKGAGYTGKKEEEAKEKDKNAEIVKEVLENADKKLAKKNSTKKEAAKMA